LSRKMQPYLNKVDCNSPNLAILEAFLSNQSVL
jgi:hypothetical protein